MTAEVNDPLHDGWATRTEGRLRTYEPTLRIVALAAQLAERSPLARAAQPVVTRLYEETGAVTHLAVPSYRSTLCLVHRAAEVDARPRLRELVPAHATAGGKLLLAYRDAWRESVLESPLERLTDLTVTDAAALRTEGATVVERGFAVEVGELEADSWSLAVGVRDAEGSVVSALACSGTGAFGDATERERLVDRLTTAADEIAARLAAPAVAG